MSKALKSGIKNGLGASVGAFMAVATMLDPDTSIAAISSITWAIIIATGIGVGLKDSSAQKTQPE